MPLPGDRKAVFKALETPEEIEETKVSLHGFVCEHNVERGIDPVVEREYIPALVPGRWLKHTNTKTRQYIGIVILSIGRTNGRLQKRDEVVSVHLVRRLIQLDTKQNQLSAKRCLDKAKQVVLQKKIHQVLDEVALSQQQIVLYRKTMLPEVVGAIDDIAELAVNEIRRPIDRQADGAHISVSDVLHTQNWV